MNFEVNGQTYFLNFNPGKGQWVLLTPTNSGIERLEVFDDRAPIVGAVQVLEIPSDEQGLD